MSTAAVDDFTSDSNGTAAPIDAPVETPTDPVIEAPVEQAPAVDAGETGDLPGETGETPEQAEARARDEQGRFAQQPAKKKASPQARIDEAVLLQRKAERDRDYWRQQAEHVSRPPQRSEAGDAWTRPAPQGEAEPTFEQFSNEPDPYLAFVDARTEWRVQQALRQERERTQHAYVQQSNQARVAKFYADVEAMRATTPDFDSAVAVLQQTPVSAEVSQAILEAEDPALVALHLARHASEYDQIRGLSGPSLHRALGRLEARLGAAHNHGPTSQAYVTKANPPIKPLGTSPIVSDSPPTDRDSDDAHFEYWNRKDREAKRR